MDNKIKIEALKHLRQSMLKEDAKRFKKEEKVETKEGAPPLMMRILQLRGKEK